MAPPRKKGGCIAWDKMYAPGENPGGFTSQTANGTAHDKGPGHNHNHFNFNQQADGSRWNGKPSFGFGGEMGGEGGEAGSWGPKANRTGE